MVSWADHSQSGVLQLHSQHLSMSIRSVSAPYVYILYYTTVQLQIKFARNNYSRHFYFIRIAKVWNKLPSNLINLDSSLGTIKKKTSDFLVSDFLENFDTNNLCSFHMVCPCSKCHIGSSVNYTYHSIDYIIYISCSNVGVSLSAISSHPIIFT